MVEFNKSKSVQGNESNHVENSNRPVPKNTSAFKGKMVQIYDGIKNLLSFILTAFKKLFHICINLRSVSTSNLDVQKDKNQLAGDNVVVTVGYGKEQLSDILTCKKKNPNESVFVVCPLTEKFTLANDKKDAWLKAVSSGNGDDGYFEEAVSNFKNVNPDRVTGVIPPNEGSELKENNIETMLVCFHPYTKEENSFIEAAYDLFAMFTDNADKFSTVDTSVICMNLIGVTNDRWSFDFFVTVVRELMDIIEQKWAKEMSGTPVPKLYICIDKKYKKLDFLSRLQGFQVDNDYKKPPEMYTPYTEPPKS